MMQPDMRELKERAKREKELREQRSQPTPFQQDGFFESTNYQIPDSPTPVSSGE